MFLFQLPILLFAPPLQRIKFTTPSENWHALSTFSLQKIERTSSVHLVKQWEEYFFPNHLRFPAVDERDFLSGTRVMAVLDKMGSQHLRAEFHRGAHPFFKQFVNCVLSTVASRSVIGQGVSCFFSAIVVGGDDVVPFQLFSKLLEELLEKGWTRGREAEACRAAYQVLCAETVADGVVVHEEPP